MVWDDLRGTDHDIYSYDLVTGIETRVCTASRNQTHPAVSGRRVVWIDYRGSDQDIYRYDLLTRSEQAICTASGLRTDPRIDVYERLLPIVPVPEDPRVGLPLTHPRGHSQLPTSVPEIVGLDARGRQGFDPVRVRPGGLGRDAGGHGYHPHDAVGGEEAFRQGEAPFVGLLVHSIQGASREIVSVRWLTSAAKAAQCWLSITREERGQ